MFMLGIIPSLLAFLFLGMFDLANLFWRSGASYFSGVFEIVNFSAVLIGVFLFCGTLWGVVEFCFFQAANYFLKRKIPEATFRCRFAWYLVTAFILIVGPLVYLAHTVAQHSDIIPQWNHYVIFSIAGGGIALLVLWIISRRENVNLPRLCIAAVLSSLIFLLVMDGTDLHYLMSVKFKPVQLQFFLVSWALSLLAAFLIYNVQGLRTLIMEGVPVSSRVSRAKSFKPVLYLLAAVFFYYLDGNFYVGLYPGAHLGLKIICYISLEVFCLLLLVNFVLPRMACRRVITGKVFKFAVLFGIIVLGLVIFFGFDPSSGVGGISLRRTMVERDLLDRMLRLRSAFTGEDEVPLSQLSGDVEGEGFYSVPREGPSLPPELKEGFERAGGRRVFLILIDALRPDHLGCYGYDREGISPAIDEFAGESVVFRYCIAPGRETTASLATIFTSKIFSHIQFIDLALPQCKLVADPSPTIAQVLQDNGFYTLAAGFLLSPYWGFEKGFVDYKASSDRSAVKVIKEHLTDIIEGDSFCYCDYGSPHCGHAERYTRWAGMGYGDLLLGESKVDHYDSMVRIADYNVGRLFRVLRDENIFDNSVIMITADHGTGLGEHGYWGHNRGNYNGEVLVPLIVKAPGCLPGMVSETVGTIDLFPTIVDLLGVKAPGGLEGRSLAPFLFDKDYKGDDKRVYYHGRGKYPGLDVSILKGEYKLIHPGSSRAQLYAYKKDIAETKNLLSRLPGVAEELLQDYIALSAASPEPLEPLQPVAVSGDNLIPGLRRRLFDNAECGGEPVLEEVVTDAVNPDWNLSREPEEANVYSIEWNGFINFSRAADHAFIAATNSNVEVLINGVKLIDVTDEKRKHTSEKGYWEGYARLAAGLHKITIRFYHKKGKPGLIVKWRQGAAAKRRLPLNLCYTEPLDIPNSKRVSSKL